MNQFRLGRGSHELTAAHKLNGVPTRGHYSKHSGSALRTGLLMESLLMRAGTIGLTITHRNERHPRI
jgi:hypothetical protein